jgi:methylated-DNA-[protein]-cysteine S-methyltransferase
LPKTFNEQCYQLLQRIPKGRVVTYGDIAHALNTKAYQAVGNAMAANPNPIIVPCHRVVKSNGEVGNYALGRDRKIELLRSEGIRIENNKVVDFNAVRYQFTDKEESFSLLFYLPREILFPDALLSRFMLPGYFSSVIA